MNENENVGRRMSTGRKMEWEVQTEIYSCKYGYHDNDDEHEHGHDDDHEEVLIDSPGESSSLNGCMAQLAGAA